MPGDALDEHQALDEVRPVEREHQAQPAAHRVADVGRVAAARADRRRGRLEVESFGDVERGEVDVCGELRDRRGPTTTTSG